MSAPPEAPRDLGNPYVGPRALQDGDPIYGRDRELGQLLDRVLPRRIVLMYAPSGAGKTSLVQAGLIPRLRDEGYTVHPIIRVITLPAGPANNAGNPFIASAVASIDPNAAANESTAGFAARLAELRTDEDTLEFLIFDQFEELIRDASRKADIDEFMADVGIALRDHRRWALFIMREDRIAGLDPYLRHVPTSLSVRFRLDYLSCDAARTAVQAPARGRGVRFTADAVDRIVNDLSTERVDPGFGVAERQGNRVEPVQLQVVCARIWDALEDGAGEIGVAHVEEFGDVDDALGAFYDENLVDVVACTKVREPALRAWFGSALITADGFRAQVSSGPRARHERAAQDVLQHLQDGHLVRAERQRGTVWYELTHDRLVQPVQRRNERWQAARARRRRRWTALLIVVAVLLGAAAAFYGWSRRDHAEHAAVARSDAAAGLVNAARSAQLMQPALALQLGIAAATLDPSPPNRAALIATLAGNRLLSSSDTGRSAVSAVVFSPDGRLLVSGTARNAAVLWDVSKPGAARRLALLDTGHGGPVDAAAFTADGRSLVTASSLDSSVVRWDITDPARPRAVDKRVVGGGGNVDVAAIGPDAQLLLTGSTGSAAALWSTTNLTRAVAELPAGAAVTAVTIGADGRFAAVGSAAGTVDVWTIADAPRPRRIASLPGGPPPVQSVALGAQGTAVAVGYTDGTTNIWNVADPARPALTATLRTHGQPVTAVAFSPDGRRLATGSADRTATLWAVTAQAGATFVARLAGHTDAVATVAFSPDGTTAATGAADRLLNLWRTGDPVPVPRRATLAGHRGAITAAAFSADGRRLVTAGRDRTVLIWDLQPAAGPQLTAALTALSANVIAVGFSPDTQSIITVDTNATASRWTLANTAGAERVVSLGGGPIGGAAITTRDDGGTSVAIVGARQPAAVSLWDPFTDGGPRVTATIGGQAVAIAAAAVPAVLIGTTSAAELWETTDLAHPSLVGRINGRGGSADRVTVSGNGRLAMTASTVEGSATLWSLERPGTPVPMSTVYEEVGAFAFNARSDVLVRGAPSQTSIWATDPQAPPVPLGTVNAEAHPVSVVAVSPDSRALVVGAADGTLTLWDLDAVSTIVTDPIGAACAVVGQGLAPPEWTAFLPGFPYERTCDV